MKILVINLYAGSESYGMEYRPYYLGREWVRQGHDVTVVAGTYSHLRARNPWVGKDLTEEIIDGVRYVWLKTPPYGKNGVKRLISMATFVAKLRMYASRLARTYQPDAVIASSTFPIDFWVARRIAAQSHGKAFFEIHDLWPLTPIALHGLSETSLVARVLWKLEDRTFADAARIFSIVPNADRYIKERGFDAGKFVYIPNGIVVPAEVADVDNEQIRAVRAMKESGCFVVMYLGGFAEANALDELVESAALVDDDVRIVLIGEGMGKAAMERLAEARGSGRVVFLPPVPKPAVQATLREADCLYIGARDCTLYQYGIGMNKIFDYMLAAKPVIMGIRASNDPIAEAGCGITIPPQDQTAIADAIRELRSLGVREREEMGARGYTYVVARHDYKVLAARFADALRAGIR